MSVNAHPKGVNFSIPTLKLEIRVLRTEESALRFPELWTQQSSGNCGVVLKETYTNSQRSWLAQGRQ